MQLNVGPHWSHIKPHETVQNPRRKEGFNLKLFIKEIFHSGLFYFPNVTSLILHVSSHRHGLKFA